MPIPSESLDQPYNADGGGGVGAKHPLSETFPLLVAPSVDGKGKNTIRMELIPVACWKLNNVRFLFGSSFLLPQTRSELVELLQLRKEHRGAHCRSLAMPTR